MVASRVGAVLLALAMGGCNLGSAVEACSEDADCPEGSSCDTELQACVEPTGAPTGAPAGDPADAGR